MDRQIEKAMKYQFEKSTAEKRLEVIRALEFLFWSEEDEAAVLAMDLSGDDCSAAIYARERAEFIVRGVQEGLLKFREHRYQGSRSVLRSYDSISSANVESEKDSRCQRQTGDLGSLAEVSLGMSKTPPCVPKEEESVPRIQEEFRQAFDEISMP